jgi:hypothetical protein
MSNGFQVSDWARAGAHAIKKVLGVAGVVEIARLAAVVELIAQSVGVRLINSSKMVGTRHGMQLGWSDPAFHRRRAERVDRASFQRAVGPVNQALSHY